MIPPTGLKLSRSRGPVVVVYGKEMLLHQYLKKLLVTWNWNVWPYDNQYYRLKVGKYAIKVTPYFFGAIYGEWLDWKRYYLPINLSGATILDVGAGSGETALFYFLQGAKRIVCVEPDKRLSETVQENIRSNQWNAEVLTREFGLDLLQGDFDFMKMDCEGCEAKLLNAPSIPRCVIEVHTDKLLAALKDRFDLRLGTGSVQYLIATSPRLAKPSS
ncbi:MAG TPA: 50S ribosomal protein L11 methyltransferase [Candidatus Bathyarchaeia archaeon]|nr:50S ribosomal protein L11 methyltransferase [Candidatus Bathyarchaeia archaeon]